MTYTNGIFTAQLGRLSHVIAGFRDDDSGATAIEYSLIVGLIFLVIVAAVTNYTNSTSAMYENISTNLTN